jgi:hypothetical protein
VILLYEIFEYRLRRVKYKERAFKQGLGTSRQDLLHGGRVMANQDAKLQMYKGV